jgi:hypothetical protein
LSNQQTGGFETNFKTIRDVEMALKGDIQSFSLAAITRMIHAENKSGTLEVSNGRQTVHIYFKKGEIVFVKGDLAEDLSLGSLLKTNNFINEEDIQTSLEIAEATGKRLGVILIEHGHISQDKLVNILRYQFKEAIAKVLAWNVGEFYYTSGLGDHVEDIQLQIDPIRLMAEAQQWKEYRSLIPNDQVVFQIKSEAIKSDSLSGDSPSRVRLLINGQRNVAQIIAETGLSRYAVYRALAALSSQGAIFRQDAANKPGETAWPDNGIIIQFHLNVLNEMLSGLAGDLGSKKAVFLLEKSLKAAPNYDSLFCALQLDEPMPTNLERLHGHLSKQRKKILSKDLVNSFHSVIVNLLREEYQVLGFRSSQNTLGRIQRFLNSTHITNKLLTDALNPLLQKYAGTEEQLRNRKTSSETMGQEQKLSAEQHSSLPSDFDKLGGATIIDFYREIIQMLINDLESEIGLKALDLFRDIMTASDAFLSQFNSYDSTNANVQRIQKHIKSRNQKINKKNMVLAFQQVLLTLLHEQSRLLGDKAAQKSFAMLQAHLHDPKQKKYGPLVDQLITLIDRKQNR